MTMKKIAIEDDNQEETHRKLQRMLYEEPIEAEIHLSFDCPLKIYHRHMILFHTQALKDSLAHPTNNRKLGHLVSLQIFVNPRDCLTPASLDAWASALEECIHLKVFSCDNTFSVCNDDWRMILPLLERPNNSLEELTIPHSGDHHKFVHDSGIFERLFDAIGKSNTIKKLYFYPAHGYEYKVEADYYWEALDQEDFDDQEWIHQFNQDKREDEEVDEKQTGWIAKMVAKNSSLKEMKLVFSPVCSLVGIFQALKHNNSIQHLEIVRDRAGGGVFRAKRPQDAPNLEEESKAMEELVEHNCFLQYVDFVDGGDNPEISQRSEAFLEVNRRGRAHALTATQEEWVEHIATADKKEDTNYAFCYIQANLPTFINLLPKA